MSKYTYAFGYRTREAAETALEDMFACGEVSQAERPTVESYSMDTANDTMMKRRPKPLRWCIKLEGN